MLAELLDPAVLSRQLGRLHEGGALDDETYRTARAELRRARRAARGALALRVLLALARALRLTQARAGDSAAARAYIPRHTALSVLQSTLHECIEKQGSRFIHELESDLEGMFAVTNRSIARVDDELFGPFALCDVRWLSTYVAEAFARLRKPPPFPAAPAPPVRIGDDARIVLVGDWGTGVPRALAMAPVMAAQLEGGPRDQHVVHLGDVYYSGYGHEYRARLLEPWPVEPGSPVGSWTLNGNHDMYSGGHDYFGVALGDPRFARQQRSSWFSFENDHWRVLALDTAYTDEDLAGGQAKWVAEAMADSSRKVMLLSHHQLFSAWDRAGPKIRERLAPALALRPVDAWFWGHEHRCAVYEPNEEARYAAVVGHGGVPVLVPRPEAPLPKGVAYEFREAHEIDGDRWGLFGFAVLDFDGPRVRVRYLDERGTEQRTDEI
jgi:hypothetical protein